ncbi:MAG TPA: family 1 encapsulin nanocompartment shell protein [Solirubrobacteraceae bacterium]|nr:family 1 encapsulin nanocompartment shell protein [Solirubrobacteraceae bacterium]
MSHLLREHAPITELGWKMIDEEARGRLTPALAARKLVDFAGPHGWEHSAVGLGRTTAVASAPTDGVSALQRRVLALVELRSSFSLAREELRDADRGAADVDLGALDASARRIAIAENVAVFHGWEAAGITGIVEASSHKSIELGEDCERYTRRITRAVETLLSVGVGGPYGLALGAEAYTRVLESSEQGGYPLLDHLREIIGGPLVWAPGVHGAVLISQRGGDFVLDVGEDLSIGYDHHDASAVELYLEESFAFRVLEPDAAVALTL